MNDQLAPASTTHRLNRRHGTGTSLDRVPDSALDEAGWLALLITIDQEEGGP